MVHVAKPWDDDPPPPPINPGPTSGPDRRKATDPVLARDLGQRLCSIFGLSAERTRRITIDLGAGEFAAITVEQLVTQGQAEDLAEVATLYGLHRADQRHGLPPGFIIRDLRPETT